jgi:hypothetical protein
MKQQSQTVKKEQAVFTLHYKSGGLAAKVSEI